MSDKPKRRFWQIHLSTAIVLMVVLGLLVPLNVLPHSSPSSVPFLIEICYGWPRDFLFVRWEYTKIKGPDCFVLQEGGTGFSNWHSNSGIPAPPLSFNMLPDQEVQTMDSDFDLLGMRLHSLNKIDKKSIIIDILSAFAIILLAGLTLEHLIRRREARKT